MKKSLKIVVGCVATVLVCTLAFWAGTVVTGRGSATENTIVEPVTVEVVEASIGQTLTLTTVVERGSRPVAMNTSPGVVVSVTDDPTFAQGKELYRVGGTPVVMVRGNMPFWRDIGPGLSGPDVAQFAAMLADLGYLTDPDAVFGPVMTGATKAWYQDQGRIFGGTIALGELVAVPEGVSRIMLDEGYLYPGANLFGGEPLVSSPRGDPEFHMVVSPSQATIIPPGTSVSVRTGETRWEGVTGEGTAVDDGIALAVTAPDGSTLCGTECALLPDGAVLQLLTDVVIVPPATGPTVPVSALIAGPRETTVQRVTASGTEGVRVEVVSVSQGLAVVEGVSIGDRVLILASEETE